MKIFDFIIVGGGTSGTVTAEKLIKKFVISKTSENLLTIKNVFL